VKPVKQTKIYEGPGTCGNCLTACVSSLLEIPIEQIPNFVEDREDWQTYLNEFLEPYNMVYVEVPVSAIENQDLGYHLICGFTVRSDVVPHAVVAFNRKYYHDPHPSNAGLKNFQSYGIFCVLDPSKQKRSRLVDTRDDIYICEYCGEITTGDCAVPICCSEPHLWSEKSLKMKVKLLKDDGKSAESYQGLLNTLLLYRGLK
jgi:hypothetical protein